MAPTDEEVADKVSVLPEQRGPLLLAVGAMGAAGLTRLNGPIAFDVHPLKLAVILVYVPPDKLEMMITPLAFEVSITVVGLPPFLTYCIV